MKKANLYAHIYTLLLIMATITSCGAQPNAIVPQGTTPLSIVETLKEKTSLSLKEKIELYHKLKKENPDGYTFSNEDELTMYGYSFLWNDQIKEALEIFKLILAEFPESSNAYDSLGEAYLKNGDKERSLAHYEKSLAMNPSNFNAEDQIDLIKNPDKKIETSAEKFDKIYSPQAYKDDLDQLGKALTDIHPYVFKFISKEDFWKLIEEKKAQITDHTTYSEFNWHCTQILASINCSHTSMGRFDSENEMLPMSLRFPIQTRWVNERLYVIDPLNNEKKVAQKDEILSINGIDVSALISDIYKHIPSQGYIETSKKHDFNRWSTVLIPFALDFPEAFELEIKGTDAPVILNPAERHDDPINDPSIKYCGDDLCFEMLENGKDAVLTIYSFNYYSWNNFGVFKDFMDKSFKEINENGIENLIIDLRFNGGGSPESSIYLLRYLVDKPFTYFVNSSYPGASGIHEPFEDGYKGKSYYLIDGNGKSTTGHFMAMVKDLKLGTIIGEELGSNQFCTGGQTICRLSNTKLVYYVANSAAEFSVKSFPEEKGILPDRYVTQNIYEYLNNVDKVKEFTIDFIEKERLYFLETDSTWTKEIFEFPLGFAQDINYKGVEDARFPVGWRDSTNSNFWSYVFAWNIEHNEEFTENELEENLKKYFDGLMRVQNTIVHLERQGESDAISKYKGSIKTTDSFFTKKAMTLNVQVDKYYCAWKKKSIVLFRYSPKEFGNGVWDKLKEVRLGGKVCDL